ncbi:hypothetical protein EYF80_038157 [Liparis tanakae]|uniref:Uncharacterized protein n=1 Tax=Liparis tanakae TaxID=230148 RepID=A0A4Z2GEK6_9TELE|nr:hypothetical protein EYF80_038157 [Liparis tanakae]
MKEDCSVFLSLPPLRPAVSPHDGGDVISGVSGPIQLPIRRLLPASRLSGEDRGLYAAGARPNTHWAAGAAPFVMAWCRAASEHILSRAPDSI